jgi:hypothetical protein
MNIIIDCSHIAKSPKNGSSASNNLSIENLYFQEKKNNIIINGTFTKVVYSTGHFSMNGLYLYLPFIFAQNKHQRNVYQTKVDHFKKRKQYIDLDTTQPINYNIIEYISEFEDSILKYYKRVFNVEKTSSYTLRNQLMTGTINISIVDGDTPPESQTNFGLFNSLMVHEDEMDHKYILKISGIWENAQTIGITYKFIQMKQVV